VANEPNEFIQNTDFEQASEGTAQKPLGPYSDDPSEKPKLPDPCEDPEFEEEGLELPRGKDGFTEREFRDPFICGCCPVTITETCEGKLDDLQEDLWSDLGGEGSVDNTGELGNIKIEFVEEKTIERIFDPPLDLTYREFVTFLFDNASEDTVVNLEMEGQELSSRLGKVLFKYEAKTIAENNAQGRSENGIIYNVTNVGCVDKIRIKFGEIDFDPGISIDRMDSIDDWDLSTIINPPTNTTTQDLIFDDKFEGIGSNEIENRTTGTFEFGDVTYTQTYENDNLQLDIFDNDIITCQVSLKAKTSAGGFVVAADITMQIEDGLGADSGLISPVNIDPPVVNDGFAKFTWDIDDFSGVDLKDITNIKFSLDLLMDPDGTEITAPETRWLIDDLRVK